jgi:hypothetical protein
MSLNNIEVSTNLGPICDSSFFIANATNAVLLTAGAMVLGADAFNSITSTGQVMSFNLRPAQPIFLRVNGPLNYTNRLVVTGPGGVTNLDYVITPIAAGNYDYWGTLINPTFPGAYTMQFIPLGAASESVTFEFHNDNGTSLVTLANNMMLSASVGPYLNDYAKFKVNLNAGQTLSMGATPNNNYTLNIYNNLGVYLTGGAGIPVVFTAPATGTYYVVFFNNSLTANTYNTTVSISP